MIHCARAETASPEYVRQFSALIVDPPYSQHVHQNATSIGTGGRGARHRDLGFAHCGAGLRQAIARASSLVKGWSLVFTDTESAHLWRDECRAAGAEYVRTIPWVRWSQPQLSGDRPPTGHELVLVFHHGGKKRWNGPGNLTAFTAKALRGRGKHPTEKPLDLLLAMVSWFSNPGEQVLDLCAGAGTTMQACRLLGRPSDGWEADPAWAAKAQLRLKEPLSERDLERAGRFFGEGRAEAGRIPTPRAKNGSDVRTWERAQRRLADADRVEGMLAA